MTMGKAERSSSLAPCSGLVLKRVETGVPVMASPSGVAQMLWRSQRGPTAEFFERVPSEPPILVSPVQDTVRSRVRIPAMGTAVGASCPCSFDGSPHNDL